MPKGPSVVRWPWLRRRALSFVHAMRGLGLLCLTQPNFRIHLAAAFCGVALGLIFGIMPIEWLVLVIAITLVITAETFNTVLEKMVDLVQRDLHPIARDAKDIAAAGVLLASIGAVIIGVILFGPRLIRLLTG